MLIREGQKPRDKGKSELGMAPLLKSHARLDQLIIPEWATKLPDGRDVRSLDPVEFSRAVNPLGLGLDQSLGHQSRVAQYVDKLTGIFNRAGEKAVQDFLQEARGSFR